MEKHIKLVAILYFVLCFMGLFAAAAIYFILNLAGQISGDYDASCILGIVSKAVAAIILISLLPTLIGAWGLLKHKEWARILVLVISVINLVNFPLGTALGSYAIWTLVQPESLALFNPQNRTDGRA